jgi:hypothetical protein
VKRPLLPCRHEAEVLASARRARLDDELAAHARDCRGCSAAAATGAALRQTAASFAVEARLPDPQELLRRAADERLRLATERALLPLRLARNAAIAAGAGAAVVLLPQLLAQLHWNTLAPLHKVLPSGGSAWVANCALLLAFIVGALWLHWEEA